MEPTDVRYFESPAAFRGWLQTHHERRDELWVGYWKKATGRPSMTWPESVDEALCYGWIDGIRKRVDEESYTIRFTPRRRGSVWSLRNMQRFDALLAEGRIAPAGSAAHDRRREDRTGVYSFERASPPELSREHMRRLRSNAKAWADWQARPAGYRRQVAHWVASGKRASTRERRLASLIEDSAAGRKVKPFR
jgi:uncharacterized protein YdeI (YjbR/CyaY-like superfamily)